MLTSALVIGVILLAMNRAGTIYSQKDLQQPKHPFDMAAMRATARQGTVPGDAKQRKYFVWHAVEGNAEGRPRPASIWSATPDGFAGWSSGHQWPVGPTRRRTRGAAVSSTAGSIVCLLVTDGILNQKLPWSLVY